MQLSTETQPDRLNLLLVDDYAPERDFYETALEREFNVFTANRGPDALILLGRIKPDAIVLDVNMPEMSGWETCERIKTDAQTADIPVIMLTGTDDLNLAEHATQVGASALLRKPCPPEQLRDTIFGTLQVPKRESLHTSPASRSTLASILVVDDDVSVTRTFSRILQIEGFDVFTALDVESGLRQVDAHHPDAILLDLRLPLEGGLAFLRRLRSHEERRHVPVALITGEYFLDDAVLRELSALRAELHFKPVWVEDLGKIVEDLLDGNRPGEKPAN